MRNPLPFIAVASLALFATVPVVAQVVPFGTQCVGPATNGIAFTPGPCATPTPRPTPPPTPTPTALPTTTFLNLQNAKDWGPNFTPWSKTSMWNAPISANPTIASYSAKVIANQFPNAGAIGPFRATEAGMYDYSHPRFFATSTDPLVTLTCDQYCNPPDNGGVPRQIRVPAKARPVGGADAHFDVVQPDGTDITMWAVYGSPGSDPTWTAPHDMQTRDWQTGDVLAAGNIANCGNFATAAGVLSVGPGPTAADVCTNGGQVLASELISGVINHAVNVGGQCAIGMQYPAAPGASTQQCTSGIGPALGGREWYDVPCATTRATSIQLWKKAILCALNQYGGYFTDNGSGGAFFTGGISVELESEEPWRNYNGTGTNNAFYTSPYAPLAAQGWSAITIPNAIGSNSGLRWVGADPWQPWVDLGQSQSQFVSHMHWLDQCSARGTC